jgi:hypothetical protein
MANYTVTTPREKTNGDWVCSVTYNLPDVAGCVDSTVVKFTAASEQELDDEVTRFIIKINNNVA